MVNIEDLKIRIPTADVVFDSVEFDLRKAFGHKEKIIIATATGAEEICHLEHIEDLPEPDPLWGPPEPISVPITITMTPKMAACRAE